jgi:hypothetical protein
VLTVNLHPVADAGPDKEICEGDSVVIGGNPTASGGTPPHTCNWNPTTGLDDPAKCNPNASPGSTTVYEVTVTDSKGCSDTDSMVLTVNPNPVADAGPDKEICQGGSIEIGGSPTASGGTPGYTYSWSPTTGLDDHTKANPTASPASTTTYCVTVTDSKGCSDHDCMVLTVNPNPTADAGPDKEICEGDSVEIGGSPTASGGTPPHTCNWSPAIGLDDPTKCNPIASPDIASAYVRLMVEDKEEHRSSNRVGISAVYKVYLPMVVKNFSASVITYCVTVTDSKGCTDTDCMALTVHNKPEVNAGPDEEICEGGSIEIGGNPTASGGTPPYSYSWSPTAGLDDPSAPNPIASPASSTAYCVTVTDSKGCSDYDCMVLTVNPNPTADAGPDREICQGGSVVIGGSPTASGGTPGYTCNWSPATGLDDPAKCNPTASPGSTTTYQVTVTDSKGCTDTDSMVLTVNPNPTAYAGDDQSKCQANGTTTFHLSGSASGGTPSYSYHWSSGDPCVDIKSSYSQYTDVDITCTGSRTITLQVTDARGCQDTDHVILTVKPKPAPTACSNSPVCEEGTIKLYGGPDGMDSYCWVGPGGWASCERNPTRSGATTAMAGTYILTVTKDGCSGTVEVAVDVLVCECEELICNGDFENQWSWIISNTPRPAYYSTAVVKSGSWSMHLGITDQSDVYSYSSIYQEVAIPGDAATVTLSFWYYPICHDAFPNDWQTVAIYDPAWEFLAYALPKSCSNSQTWTYRTFDLTPYRGQTVMLYFDVRNDGEGNLKTAMYVDDVSIQVCRP